MAKNEFSRSFNSLSCLLDTPFIFLFALLRTLRSSMYDISFQFAGLPPIFLFQLTLCIACSCLCLKGCIYFCSYMKGWLETISEWASLRFSVSLTLLLSCTRVLVKLVYRIRQRHRRRRVDLGEGLTDAMGLLPQEHLFHLPTTFFTEHEMPTVIDVVDLQLQ